jgi:hypothetical protein
MVIGARSASEAACKVVRAMPNALVFGYPVPMNAEVVRDCEEFA